MAIKIEHTFYGLPITEEECYTILFRVLKNQRLWHRLTYKMRRMPSIVLQSARGSFLMFLKRMLIDDGSFNLGIKEFIRGYSNNLIDTSVDVMQTYFVTTEVWMKFLENCGLHSFHYLDDDGFTNLKFLMIRNIDRSDVVNYSFRWDDTSEGFEYWSSRNYELELKLIKYNMHKNIYDF